MIGPRLFVRAGQSGQSGGLINAPSAIPHRVAGSARVSPFHLFVYLLLHASGQALLSQLGQEVG